MDEIAQYWLVLKRRWMPAALVFALTTAVATVWTFKQQEIFQAKGQVILKKTNKTSALLSSATNAASGGAIGELEGLTGSTPVNTQAEILKSLTTIKGALVELRDGKYANRPERKRLDKFINKNESFVQQLKVSSIKNTDLLEVTFQDPSRELARDVVEKIMEIYIRDDRTNQRREAEAARKFVAQELPKIETEVKQAENDLRLFKEQYNVVDLPTESVKAVETITSLNKEITSASAQLAAETSRLEGLKNLFGGRDAQATIQSGLVSESPGLQKSLKELQEVEAKIATERTRFSDNDPSILNLKEKRQALVEILQKRFKQSLIGEQQFQGKLVELQPSGIQGNLIADYAKSEAQRTSLQKQIAALVYVVDAYKQRMNALPKLEQQQNALGRKLETTRTNYKTLLSKLQEIEIAENQTLGNSRILTHAELPQEALSPKKGQNIAIGGFLGLFLGAATAFLLDGADKRIKTSEEAKNLLPGYPILGQIPVFEKSRQLPKLSKGAARAPGQLVLTGMTTGIEGESFRMLQTNLQFLNADDSLKVVVVSSSQSGEGKSTVAANLALAVAELGKRVLLVDADMRKPAQHLIWRQGNYEGLSNVLSGQCDRKTATTEIQPNLFLVTAGVVPPNPVVLLDSVQMSTSIAQWSQEYDLVIIDAPPLTVAADAAILGTQAGGLVFVLRPGVADKESVEYAQEILNQSKLKVLGMVLNGVDLDKQNRYNHYYYSSQTTRGSEEGNIGSKLLTGTTTNRTRS
ncbi:GumC family protein [Chamaesiphon minutus]|uniref:non-specific protein-tyrosine kinase n=1 Tax=Chamaesiphon minutus (strain ATCC 27169 / PCC 6605) TaxID=1173020 RepID=K9UA41_CHAP6|nr:polysaccharide biosynthesis tyrosine autokinase [Chamaesiphon minutus]AFY91977.1 capsular exopolysaccharide biosynthesis protein [Chamaesiphon minutus PCC 6605]